LAALEVLEAQVFLREVTNCMDNYQSWPNDKHRSMRRAAAKTVTKLPDLNGKAIVFSR
jgi:hypothetical protein